MNTRVLRVLAAVWPALLPSLASAQSHAPGDSFTTDAAEFLWTASRPDGHAPIGVMGDHQHRQEEWMLSYRFMRMEMDGNRDGTSRQSTGDVLAQFPVAPTYMTMEMHMFGAMYAVSDELTLMGMVPYIQKEMDHETRTGGRFTTKSEGIGDIGVTGLYSLWESGGQRLHLNAGISLPTGSISEQDATPAGRARLPYPMQLGSGTLDFLPGLTYLGMNEDWSWGGQSQLTLRPFQNSKDYTLGNRYAVTAWGARKVCSWMSTSLRANMQWWQNIRGADDLLNPRLVPTADPDRQAGKRLDLLVGVNLYAPEGRLSGNRAAIEFGLPLYQNLDGPQLETDWLMTVGWQLGF